MKPPKDSPNIRKGKFVNLDSRARKRYLDDLNRKISKGYFFSDKILDKIVDDIAPILSDCVEADPARC